MSELKRIRVREAKIRDIGLFKKLWKEVIEQNIKEGSIVQVTDKTMFFYESLFNIYVEGTLDGIVLFVADKAVLMWGDNAAPVDYSSKFIMNWGIFVGSEQSEEIEKVLLDYATNWSKQKGFEGILMEQYKDSKSRENFESVVTVLHKSFNLEEGK